MMRRWALALIFCGTCTAFAQAPSVDDDDLLTPLMPAPGTPSQTPAAKATKPQKKKSKAAKPRGKDGKDNGGVGDDLLAPLLPQSPNSGMLWVRLQTPVKGARAYLNDREWASLPAPVQSLPEGEYRLVVKRLGYADFSQRVALNAGKTTEVSVQLEPTAAVLILDCDVVGADVFVDGQRLGRTPVGPLLFRPGNANIVVSKAGFQTFSQEVSFKLGKDLTLLAQLVALDGDRPERVDLTPSGVDSSSPSRNAFVESKKSADAEVPVYKRWYVWAGAAVGVAAIATTAALLASSQSTPKFDVEFRGRSGIAVQ